MSGQSNMDRRYPWLLIGCITLVALLPRAMDLDAILSPDEPQWERNTLGFYEGLISTDVTKLYQQPHPGITTTWLAAPTIHAQVWGVKRLPQAIVLAFSVGLMAYLGMKLWGPWVGSAIGLMLALNPQLIAHSRILAMDALLSTCIVISLLAYLVWRKDKSTPYLILSGIFAALSPLSKMSGAIVVVYLVVLLLIDAFFRYRREGNIKRVITPLLTFGVAGLLTTLIIFPTLFTHPGYVWEGTKQFFGTEHYSQTVHALGPWWYPEAIAIWTTPFNWVAILLLLPVIWWQKSKRRDIATLLCFVIVFFLLVQYSIKKGDRYLLPDFLLLDILSVIAAAGFFRLCKTTQSAWQRILLYGIGIVVGLTLMWQIVTVAQLHPHYLAYRNPWTRSLAVGRTMGWGEGLDVAADYLNQKPNAQNLLVASYYESSFAYHFVGKFTSAERLAKESAEEIGADYVVLYRTMEGRAPERWETRVLAEYANKIPERAIYLNREAYVWIYKIR